MPHAANPMSGMSSPAQRCIAVSQILNGLKQGNSDLLPIKWSDATPVKHIVSELVTKTIPSTDRKQGISEAELI
ncbi:hypothetical protein U0070_021944 [Myodes glareolus]|uniref:Uncharacterized protein n=1 Tax=Myodes glareolus TaxID=447135 RepID=A0AAW0HX26_MYOGA